MTPEAIRTVAAIRREFYRLFAVGMKVPVSLPGGASLDYSHTASWMDGQQRLNFLHVYAHSAPDALIPNRPLLLRLVINKGTGTVARIQRGQDCQGLNRGWQLELTLLPEEVLDFLPWVVSFAKAHDSSYSTALLQQPPHAFVLKEADGPLFDDVWTDRAHQLKAAAQSDEAELLRC